MNTRSEDATVGLVERLRALPTETEWFECKVNNWNPDQLGEYISALSNSALLSGQEFAYIVWGIDDATREVCGTKFSPRTTKIGNEELENWLRHLLTPEISLRFHELELDGHQVVVLRIGCAFDQPVRFKQIRYIRVGSYKKKLLEHPSKERELWKALDRVPFEVAAAEGEVTGEGVLDLLDYQAYFDLLEQPLPMNQESILESLAHDRLIQREESGRWLVTNLGAVLLARSIDDFRSIRRKAMRVIFYGSNSRASMESEHLVTTGYASGFQGLMRYVLSRLPVTESIHQSLRRETSQYPELAVRELVANALIHQDFTIGGAGPMVEVFTDRIEISNPGVPLVAAERFLDAAPQSRNEDLASLMRRIGICEERGSGIDRVVFETELHQLPAPIFEADIDSTRAVLFAPRPLSEMSKEDRIRACYLHACLQYVKREDMKNKTLRARFGVDEKNSSTISRHIKEAVNAGMIKPYDEGAAKKDMRYIPFWA